MAVSKSDQYSKKETARRTEAALRAAFTTPHKSYEESKLGKPKTKQGASPKKKAPPKRG